MQKVVVDIDAGSDDAVALLLLLTCERQGGSEVVGVTCTHGNTTLDNVCRNVLLVLQSINKFNVPVFRGAEGPLIPFEDTDLPPLEFHGKDGFGDFDFPTPEGEIQKENAVAALNRMAQDNKGLTLICLGPLTNVALAIRTYPAFSKNLGAVYIMGGNVMGVGNSSSSAEFNFYKDPEAAHIVLSSLACPTIVLPWESCLHHDFTLKERLEEIGSSSSAHIQLLNKVEAKLYGRYELWTPCDAFLAACFLDKETIAESRPVHLSVELRGMQTRGQCVIDRVKKKKPNVEVIEKINMSVFKSMVQKMARFVPT